jgi:hypothetical protein
MQCFFGTLTRFHEQENNRAMHFDAHQISVYIFLRLVEATLKRFPLCMC